MISQQQFPLLNGLKGIQLLLHSQDLMHVLPSIRIHEKLTLSLKYRQNLMKPELYW